ncbi:hypothetical protein E2C01_062763 [Portunus trituberculatus]|uniref:Uncharacterized protein n=1 Tax=Portunus trituberculatus TaxID=210409 RepID=A0A5B7H7D6_PORTR|nr:hypothetical protein [Portunus trituberculatus]
MMWYGNNKKALPIVRCSDSYTLALLLRQILKCTSFIFQSAAQNTCPSPHSTCSLLHHKTRRKDS